MATLTSIINGGLQSINEQVIDNLMEFDYDHATAVKLVNEYDNEMAIDNGEISNDTF